MASCRLRRRDNSFWLGLLLSWTPPRRRGRPSSTGRVARMRLLLCLMSFWGQIAHLCNDLRIDADWEGSLQIPADTGTSARGSSIN